MVSKGSITLSSLVVIGLLVGACDDVASKEQKAEQTQVQADQQKAQAAQQAADKTAAAWDAAAQQADQAQARADRAWDAASVAMADERADYTARVDKVIAEIDSKLSDLRQSAYDAGASQRTLSAEVVANMDKRRAALASDESSLRQANAETWAAVKLKVDTDLDDSKNYIRTASARITSAHH